MDNIKTGELIRQRRKEKGMTQKDLAEKLHITDRAVSKWERGLCAPDISMLEPLSEVLEVSILEIICGERKVVEEKSEEVEISVKEVIRYSEEDTARKTKKLKGKLFRRFAVAIVMIILLLLTYNSLDGERFGWQCIDSYFGAVKACKALEQYDKEAIEESINFSENIYDSLVSLKEQGVLIKSVDTRIWNVKLEDMFIEIKMDFAVNYDGSGYKFACIATYRHGQIEIMRMDTRHYFTEYPAPIYTLVEALYSYYPG